MTFVAKRCAEKKEDKINTDGTILDLQETNLVCASKMQLINIEA